MKLTKEIEKEYYNKKKFIENILDLNKNYKYQYDDKDMIRIIDPETDNIIVEGKYQTIGLFKPNINLFYKSNTLDFINKKEYNSILKDFSNFVEKIDKNKKIDSYEYEKLMFYFEKDYFFCSEENIKELIYIYSNLGKWVLKIPFNKHNYKLIVLYSINKL